YWCFSLAGEFSFAVFAIYAAGAYVSLWVSQHFHGFWLGFTAAVVVTGLLGAAIRLIFFRLSPLYFAIATFGVGGLLLILFREWTDFTGGYLGIATIAHPNFFGKELSTVHDRYYLLLGVLTACLAGSIALLRSPAMRDLVFSRDKSAVAATSGLKARQL